MIFSKLAAANLGICKEAHEKTGDLDLSYPLQFVAKPGHPVVLVLEKLKRVKSHTEKFPPEQTIDFF